MKSSRPAKTLDRPIATKSNAFSALLSHRRILVNLSEHWQKRLMRLTSPQKRATGATTDSTDYKGSAFREPTESGFLQRGVCLSSEPRGGRRQAPQFGGGLRAAGDARGEGLATTVSFGLFSLKGIDAVPPPESSDRFATKAEISGFVISSQAVCAVPHAVVGITNARASRRGGQSTRCHARTARRACQAPTFTRSRAA
jgi:hypothetical protein